MMNLKWVLAGLFALLPGVGWAADFDARGALSPAPDAALFQSMEDGASLAAAGVYLLNLANGDTVNTAEALDALVIRGDGRSLHGDGYVLGTARWSLVTPIPESVQGRIEVTVWVRASPRLPTLTLSYAADGLRYHRVGHVLTGRATSDGWVELSTGPVDTTVLGRRLSRVDVSSGTDAIEVDALEVRRLGDALVPDNASCTVATVESDCRRAGECIHGRCVDSANVWGPVPYTRAHRLEYVERLAHGLTTLAGSRDAATRAAQARASLLVLADESSPRVFWQGVNLAITRFRDGHAWPPELLAYKSSMVPTIGASQTDGGSGICAGLMELDLTGGGVGYGVTDAAAISTILGEVALPGDQILKVDGMDTDEWLTLAEAFGGTLRSASDVRALQAWRALSLPALLAARATTVTLRRCQANQSCATPEDIEVDVGARVLAVLDVSRTYPSPTRYCSGRFQHAVHPLAMDAAGYAVSTSTEGDIRALEFDGTYFSEEGLQKVANALQGSPKVLLDTRLGNGGTLDGAFAVSQALRDATDPVWMMALPRAWHDAEDEAYVTEASMCVPELTSFNQCFLIQTHTPAVTAPAEQARVAMLNGADISANDILTRLLKGRPNFRLFGSAPTSGAYGVVAHMAPLLPTETAGPTVQVTDAIFAATQPDLLSARWESGHGVEPDETLTQKMSDALLGRDTMIERARAWLMETP